MPYWGPGAVWGGCRWPWGRLWVRTEYLLWWTDGFAVPELVTTSPYDTPQEEAGVLGLPETEILFGNTDMAEDVRSGGRVSFGYWFDPCRKVGIQASYLGLGHETTRYQLSSDGDPIVARPFFNLDPTDFDGDGLPDDMGPDSGLIAYPGWVSGEVEVTGETVFQGAEVLYRRNLVEGCSFRVDWLAGWRFNRLDDELVIFEPTVTGPNHPFVQQGTTLDLTDRFETENRFNGSTLGIIAEARHCRWTFEGVMKLALGNTHSQVTIDGRTIVTVPGEDPEPLGRGLLAQESNIGVYENDEFAVIPELGVMVGYDLSCHLRATFGYTFIYWSRVARPGDQIDMDIDGRQLDGLPEAIPRPEFRWVGTDMWAQGLNFGLDYRF
jgi:hypothetical protein